MVRFLHTSDWQLGMTRHFLEGEAQARFSQARFDAVRTMGRVAASEDCAFVVVAGDVFDSNQVDRRTVARALEALRTVPVPVFLLPGNHDALDATSVYRSRAFREGKPDHVVVLETTTPAPVPGLDNVEVVGAPWRSRRPLGDLASDAARVLEPTPGVTRVLVAHGATDARSPDPDDPSLISLEALERTLTEARIHYVALGDRHSTAREGDCGRIWYSGAPEPTDYVEDDPGNVLVVEADAGAVSVTPHPVGTWRFVIDRRQVDSAEDVEALTEALDAMVDKERTVLKFALEGRLGLSDWTRLEGSLESSSLLFAAVEHWERHTDLAVIPEDEDFSGLQLGGFTAPVVGRLRERAAEEGEEGETARDALALLVRLMGTVS